MRLSRLCLVGVGAIALAGACAPLRGVVVDAHKVQTALAPSPPERSQLEGVEAACTSGSINWIVPVIDGVVLIDAGFDERGEVLLRQLRGRRVLAVLLTHAHPDHRGAAHLLSAPVYLGSDDVPLLDGTYRYKSLIASLGVALAFSAPALAGNDAQSGRHFHPPEISLAFTLAGAIFFSSVRPNRRLSPDAIMGIAYIVASAAVVLLGQYMSQAEHDIKEILFGNPIAIETEALEVLAITAGADGLRRSRAFPGLWLDPQAILAGNLPAVLAQLQEGLATSEHGQFVQYLTTGVLVA